VSDPVRRALVVDDDESIRWVLEKALARSGIEALAVAGADDARALLAKERFPLVFLDVRLPDGSGLDLLCELRERQPEARAVVITAQDAMSTALEAMKLGAYDFLAKPFDLVQVASLAEEVFRRLGAAGPSPVGPPPLPAAGLVACSLKMLEVVKAIGRVAPTDATVLLTGESGTGKELVARAIHSHSSRAAGPFVTVNTAAIPRELLESELYGHERGAFTGATERRTGKFEVASGGTLLLDEIGDMPLEQQAKLLRVLQERRIERVGSTAGIEVNVRVIAASNVDLGRAVEHHLFREDLYYRLNVVPIHVPPLRERPEDIPLLVQHFLEKYRSEVPGRRVRFTGGALDVFLRYPWPGNVRELENAVRRCVVLARAEEIGEAELLEVVPALREAPALGGLPLDDLLRQAIRDWVLASEAGGRLHERLLERVERPLMELVLERTRGNQLRAARILGINRNTLRKKLVALGLLTKE
jgi:two-component system nitrogen regulation response regulator GlnG